MPKIVVPQYGAGNMLNWLLSGGADPMTALEFRLFVNDYEPGWPTGVTDFVEASGTWYEPKTVSPGLWTVDAPSTPPSLATYDEEFEWTSDTGTGTVYGYYLVKTADETVIWCQRFDVPIVLAEGLMFKIRPKLSEWSRCIPVCSESEGG